MTTGGGWKRPKNLTRLSLSSVSSMACRSGVGLDKLLGRQEVVKGDLKERRKQWCVSRNAVDVKGTFHATPYD